jgi:hypothetical protein
VITLQAFLSILGFSGFEMDDTSKFPEQSPTISDKDRRRHPRESCFIETGYRVQNLWYRGCIQDIGAGGVYVEAMESRIFLPGEDILLVARIRVLREQLRGKIAWVGRYGMGVSFQIPELDSGQSAIAENDGLTDEREAKSIGKIKNRKVFWEPSSTPGVTYRLYWSIGSGVDYHSDHVNVGTVTQIDLPDDIPSFPLTSGTFELGVSAVTEVENESDLAKATVHMDFTVPEAPKNLRVEDA